MISLLCDCRNFVEFYGMIISRIIVKLLNVGLVFRCFDHLLVEFQMLLNLIIKTPVCWRNFRRIVGCGANSTDVLNFQSIDKRFNFIISYYEST